METENGLRSGNWAISLPLLFRNGYRCPCVPPSEFVKKARHLNRAFLSARRSYLARLPTLDRQANHMITSSNSSFCVPFWNARQRAWNGRELSVSALLRSRHRLSRDALQPSDGFLQRSRDVQQPLCGTLLAFSFSF